MSFKNRINIAVVGDSNVGKTALIQRYLFSRFSQDHATTIEDFYQTTVKLENSNNDELYLMDIVDTAGVDEFKSVLITSVKQRDGYIFVYDFNEVKTLQTIDQFICGL